METEIFPMKPKLSLFLLTVISVQTISANSYFTHTMVIRQVTLLFRSGATKSGMLNLCITEIALYKSLYICAMSALPCIIP